VYAIFGRRRRENEQELFTGTLDWRSASVGSGRCGGRVLDAYSHSRPSDCRSSHSRASHQGTGIEFVV
jgi:hypothetical protein